MFSVAANKVKTTPPIRLFLSPVLVSVLWFFISGCSGVGPVVKIGLIGPFEGRHREIGYDAIYSARMAVREVNEAGGIGPYRVALVALDDFGDPEMATENARALLADPGLVVALGNWLPETTSAAAEIYHSGGLGFLSMGQAPFDAHDPLGLPDSFLAKYAEITPFDEQAGPYAGPTYDGMQLILAALEKAWLESGDLTRTTVRRALEDSIYEGMTGPVYQTTIGE